MHFCSKQCNITFLILKRCLYEFTKLFSVHIYKIHHSEIPLQRIWKKWGVTLWKRKPYLWTWNICNYLAIWLQICNETQYQKVVEYVDIIIAKCKENPLLRMVKITGWGVEKYFSDCAKLADRALENKRGFRSLRRPKLNLFFKSFMHSLISIFSGNILTRNALD